MSALIYDMYIIFYNADQLQAIGVEMPRYFSKVILSLELMQLIIGLTLNSYAIWIKGIKLFYCVLIITLAQLFCYWCAF